MSGIAIIDWAILFALTLFAWVVGGGLWAYCMQQTDSLVAAAQRFQIYGWLLFPLATLVLCAAIWTRLDNPLQQLGFAQAPGLSGFALGAITGVLLAGFSIFVNRRFLGSEPSEDDLAHLASGWHELPSLVIIAPLGEELIYRGYGLLVLEPLGLLLTAIISTLAFALMHYKPVVMLMALVAGTVLFVCYWFSGSLWVPVTAHAIANLGSWLWMRKLSLAE